MVVLLLAAGAAEGASDSRQVVQASEILAAIERGEPVEYDGVIIEGDLNLSRLDLPTESDYRMDLLVIERVGLIKGAKIVKSSISITNTEFQGAVTFRNLAFKESVDFRGTKFSGDADFFLAQLNDCAYFEETQFSGDADFVLAQFNDCAYFGEAQFSSDADFALAQFSDDAGFALAQFSGGASFTEARFGSEAHFSEAQFSGDANFLGTQFGGDADFFLAQFNDCAYFWKAQFGSEADFSEAQFSGYASFYQAQFSGDADFHKAHFSSDAFLRGLTFPRLFAIEWSSISEPICDDVTYLKFVRHFRETGQFKSADDCYYDYRTWRMVGQFPSWSKPIDFLAWITCGYGVRPGYTFCWSLAIILAFGLIFWAGNGIHKFASVHNANSNVRMRSFCPSSFCRSLRLQASEALRKIWRTPKKEAIVGALLFLARFGSLALAGALFFLARFGPLALARALRRLWNAELVIETSLRDALYFSAHVFVSQPPQDWRPKDNWKYAVLIEDILGWLLLALFLVTLGNVMIR